MGQGRQRGKGFIVAVVVAALVAGFLVVAALMRGIGSGPLDEDTNGAVAARQGQQAGPLASAGATATPAPAARGDDSSLSWLFDDETTARQPAQGEPRELLMTFASVTVRLTLAALLSALLAFPPPRYSRRRKRNPSVA